MSRKTIFSVTELVSSPVCLLDDGGFLVIFSTSNFGLSATHLDVLSQFVEIRRLKLWNFWRVQVWSFWRFYFQTKSKFEFEFWSWILSRIWIFEVKIERFYPIFCYTIVLDYFCICLFFRQSFCYKILMDGAIGVFTLHTVRELEDRPPPAPANNWSGERRHTFCRVSTGPCTTWRIMWRRPAWSAFWGLWLAQYLHGACWLVKVYVQHI